MKSSRNLRPFVKVNKPKSYSHLLKHPKKTGWTTFGAKENLILVAICIRQSAVTFGLGGGDLFTGHDWNRLILMIYRVRFSRAICVCVCGLRFIDILTGRAFGINQCGQPVDTNLFEISCRLICEKKAFIVVLILTLKNFDSMKQCDTCSVNIW